MIECVCLCHVATCATATSMKYQVITHHIPFHHISHRIIPIFYCLKSKIRFTEINKTKKPKADTRSIASNAKTRNEFLSFAFNFFPCHFSFIDFIHSCCCLLWAVCCYYENNHQWHEQNKCRILSRQTCARSSSVLRELRIIVSYENDFVGQSIIRLWADHSQTLRAVIMTIPFQSN